MNSWISFLVLSVICFNKFIYCSEYNPVFMGLQTEHCIELNPQSLKKDATSQEQNSDDICLICFEDFTKNQLSRVRFNCQHANCLSHKTHDFRSHCILNWARSEICTPRCPFCRGNMYLHESVRRDSDRNLVIDDGEIGSFRMKL